MDLAGGSYQTVETCGNSEEKTDDHEPWARLVSAIEPVADTPTDTNGYAHLQTNR